MIEITRGRDELLDEIRPLWLALRDHHHGVAPDFGPVRADDDSWARRRAQYERWLADERSFFLLARSDGDTVGYAFVRTEPVESPTWQKDGVGCVLETLSLLPDARGSGLGAQLVELVREEVARQGYRQLTLTAVASNLRSIAFYEREGFTPAFLTFVDLSVPRPG
jgi:GNAT superfamily N-acetyltransferase